MFLYPKGVLQPQYEENRSGQACFHFQMRKHLQFSVRHSLSQSVSSIQPPSFTNLSIPYQTSPKLYQPNLTFPNLMKCFQNLSKIFQDLSNPFKIFQNLSKSLTNHKNLKFSRSLQYIQTNPNLLKPSKPFPILQKTFQT